MKLSEVKKTNHEKNFVLYKMERKNNFKPLLIFSIVAIALVVITLIAYPFINNALPTMFEGMSEDYANYFTMQMGQTWGLLTIIYGSYLGYYLISSNFKGKSSGLLYSLNLSRNKIVFTKLARIIINVIIFNLIIAICSAVVTLSLGIKDFNYINLSIYLLFMTIICLQSALFIYGISLLNPKKVSPVLCLLIPIVLYFFSTIALIDESLSFLAYLTPISSVIVEGANNILNTGFAHVNYILVGVWTIIPLVLFINGLIKFNKSDLI